MESVSRNSTNYPLSVSNFVNTVELDENDILQYHQKIAYQFFTTTKNRGYMAVHGPGTGKTMLATAIADKLKDEYKIVILSAKSLQHNFKKEITKYMNIKNATPQEIDKVLKTYKFISSNAGNMLTQLSKINKTSAESEYEKTLSMFTEKINLEKTLLIVDEAQHIFNGVVNGSKNATGFYKAIMAASDVKIIFLSATPIINDPFEIVPAYNMLHGSSLLPEDYDDFYEYYVNDEKSSIKNKERFKNRIFGLTSYYGDWWQTGGVTKKNEILKREHFPDQLPTIIEYVPMSTAQYAEYANARELETQVTQERVTVKNNLQKPKSDPGSSYRVASRQISNFLLPDTVKVKNKQSYGHTKHINRLTNEHLSNLDIYSPKMKKIYENVKKHKGLNVVYSSFVAGEGLMVFSKILQANGWVKYSHFKTKKKSEFAFAFVSGSVSADERAEILKDFNHKRNMNGEYIDMILLSGAGAEGLDLKNVRSIHIMEPYWNYGRIIQIIARAVRYRSHDHFDDDAKKTVQPYIYLSDYPKDFDFSSLEKKRKKKKKKAVEKTTDVHLYVKSVLTKVLIDKFLAAMIESSIDCTAHIKKSPPDVQKKINCVLCNPTDNQLFHPSAATDLKINNQCTPLVTETISVQEIQYNDKTYYFTSGDEGLSVYKFDDVLKSYVMLNHEYENYAGIIQSIESKQQ